MRFVRFVRNARWYGFYSQEAVDKGCPVSVYQDRKGREYIVTGLSMYRDGHNYWWEDKVFVGEITNCQCVSSVGYEPSF